MQSDTILTELPQLYLQSEYDLINQYQRVPLPEHSHTPHSFNSYNPSSHAFRTHLAHLSNALAHASHAPATRHPFPLTLSLHSVKTSIFSIHSLSAPSLFLSFSSRAVPQLFLTLTPQRGTSPPALYLTSHLISQLTSLTSHYTSRLTHALPNVTLSNLTLAHLTQPSLS
jgi:hypothetical protein